VGTYDTERRPVGAFTVEQAYARYVTRAARDLIPLGHAEMVGDDHVDLGQRYASTAVVGENGAAPAPAGDPRTWEGMPGTRAPHLELLRDGAPISSIDLYDRQLVLLTGSDGAAWADAGRSMAGDLDVHVVGSGPVQDPGGAFPGAHGIGPSGAVLVRPDGIVAWRARDDAEAGPAALRGVVDTVLHRS
jgi:putative polyketide hydroxylase